MKRIYLLILAAIPLALLASAYSQTPPSGTLKKVQVTAQTIGRLPAGVTGSGSTGMNLRLLPSPGEPTAVPGTELHDNVAYIKDGYRFVDRGDAVDVMRERLKIKTGTYTCPCHRKDGTGKCEMVFTTRRITCRTGSCVGVSCLLKASAPTVRR